MNLDFALLTRVVHADAEQLFIHGGGLRIYNVGSVPTSISFGIAARFTADLNEAGDHHGIRFAGYAPEGAEPLFVTPNIEFDLRVEESDTAAGGIAVYIAFNFGGFEVQTEGVYRFEVHLDDEPAARLPLVVRALQRSPREEGTAPDR